MYYVYRRCILDFIKDDHIFVHSVYFHPEGKGVQSTNALHPSSIAEVAEACLDHTEGHENALGSRPVWEVWDFGRRRGPEWGEEAMCNCSKIRRRNKTLKMGTIYFSQQFLISSPFRYLSKYQVQKRGKSSVKDQRASPTYPL